MPGLPAAPALAEGDAEAGEDAKTKVGPVLANIIDAAAVRNPDFRYSSALIEGAEGGLTLGDENLAPYLKKPKEMIRRTKMSFAGLRKDTEIAAVVSGPGTVSDAM